MRFLLGLIIGLIIGFFLFGGGVTITYGANLQAVNEYTVKSGDTLGHIAETYGTTWEKLWELNKDKIIDPNLIYIGQRIRIAGKSAPLPIPLTRNEKVVKLTKFMFRKAGLEYMGKRDLEALIYREQMMLFERGLESLALQREIMDRLYINTRRLEVWLLAEAIVDLSPTEEKFYKLVGLAWQESHFVNRVGKHKEVGFYQFLPSTVKSFHQLDDIGLISALFNLKNDPRIATAEAVLMLNEWNWNWTSWNGGIEYQYHVNNKVYQFKQEWNRKV